MKIFRIKNGKSDTEKQIYNLKDDLKLKDSIQLQCKSIDGLNDYAGLESIRTWYVDENDVLVPERFIRMHYDEVNE